MHVRTRVKPDGAGAAWILLHGLAVSHRYLMPTAAALDTGAVHVPDLLGFGLSSAPAQVLDPGRHADVLAAWMDAEFLTGTHVLGNSFGCQVAVELAVRRPDLIAALVLVGPTVDPAAGTAAGQIRRWLRDLLVEDPYQARILAADIRDAGLPRILTTLRHSVRHHIEDRLPLVGVPVLVLRGEHDPIAPPRWAEQAARLAGNGRCADVPGAAHNAITTAGQRVARQASAFVSR
jgi:pimeloyl-ACP methyl ester carboxylesterase